MNSPVRQLHPTADTPAAPEAPALGFSLQLSLGEKHGALVIQSHIANDMPQELIDKLVDRMCASGDRARARYELAELEVELAKCRKQLQQAEADEQRCRADWEKLFDVKSKEYARREAEQQRLTEGAAAKHNRRGDFKPTGALLTNERALAGMKADLDQEHEKHKADVGNWQATQKHWHEAIREYDGKIAALKQQLGLA